jgi:hypothetical protein
MEYEQLTHEEFDAIVTGELTHFALWLEDAVNGVICEYFIGASERERDFRRLILYRDGLTFQDKLEIVRALIPVFGETAERCNLKSLLNRIEEFKSWRNSLAHGLDQSNPDEPRKIVLEIVIRSGKEKRIEITPASHREMMEKTEELLKEVEEARSQLREFYA